MLADSTPIRDANSDTHHIDAGSGGFEALDETDAGGLAAPHPTASSVPAYRRTLVAIPRRPGLVAVEVFAAVSLWCQTRHVERTRG